MSEPNDLEAIEALVTAIRGCSGTFDACEECARMADGVIDWTPSLLSEIRELRKERDHLTRTVAALTHHNEILSKACELFEENSANVTEVWEDNRAVLAVVEPWIETTPMPECVQEAVRKIMVKYGITPDIKQPLEPRSISEGET